MTNNSCAGGATVAPPPSAGLEIGCEVPTAEASDRSARNAMFYYDVVGRYSYSKYLLEYFTQSPLWRKLDTFPTAASLSAEIGFYTDRVREAPGSKFPLLLEYPPEVMEQFEQRKKRLEQLQQQQQQQEEIFHYEGDGAMFQQPDNDNHFCPKPDKITPIKNLAVRNVIPFLHTLIYKFSFHRHLQDKDYVPPSYLIKDNRFVGGREPPPPSTPPAAAAPRQEHDGQDKEGEHEGEMGEQQQQVWFLKESGKERAEGITLLRDPHTCFEHTKASKEYVLQPQVPNPLLHNGRKFDLRVMVLLEFDPKRIKTYVFKEALMRIASRPFVDGSDDKRVQFTNVCFQSRADPSHHGLVAASEECPEFPLVFPRIRAVVADVMQTVRSKLNAFRQSGFTLLGLDFLVDRALKPWLLEVNFSPAMFASSPVGSAIMKRAVTQIPPLVIEPMLLAKQLGTTATTTTTITMLPKLYDEGGMNHHQRLTANETEWELCCEMPVGACNGDDDDDDDDGGDDELILFD